MTCKKSSKTIGFSRVLDVFSHLQPFQFGMTKHQFFIGCLVQNSLKNNKKTLKFRTWQASGSTTPQKIIPEHPRVPKNGSGRSQECPETHPDGPGSVPWSAPSLVEASQNRFPGAPGRPRTPPKWCPDGPDAARAAPRALRVPPSLPRTKFWVHSGHISGLHGQHFLRMYA